MQPQALSAEGHKLVADLESAARMSQNRGEAIHISGVGGRLYFAYEQLRNAAEYGERHLLVRRAIERFLRRNLHLRAAVPDDFGIELIAEMTHARYIENDTVPRPTIKALNDIAGRYLKLVAAVRQAHKIPQEELASWIYQSASVEMEHQLIPHATTDAYIDFIYHHYLEHIDADSFGETDETNYKLAMYCAVHRSLMKSDMATIRYYALAARLGFSGGSSLEYFVWLNSTVDALLQTPLTNRLSRLISRNGAPMRILRGVLLSANDSAAALRSKGELVARVAKECQVQYKLTRGRLNDGIVRSVLFIFITKVLIGVSIEVPYDLFTTSTIAWLPLTINLLFPPAYMATLGLGVRTPGKRNTEVIQSHLARILYQTDDPPLRYAIRKRVSSRALSTIFNAFYAITFLISFGVLVYVLRRVGFNVINGAIFCVFLSAVSFLGFRLLQTARELEIIDQRTSLFGVLLDFFYTPFIRVGHWLSDRYSRLNIVAFILDLAIELPLKSSLRIIRQWAGFIRDKQEDI